jgi:hypothetical protein
MNPIEKVEFIEDFGINLSAFTNMRTYGFEFETYENEKLKNRIHYEIEIKCIQNEIINCIFEISRKQIYINNQAPDLMIEQIAEKAAETIFPILLKVTDSGEIEAIKNMDAIKKRWIIKKEEINAYYEGKIIEEIIEKTEKILLNPIALKQSICNNWFFHLYFKPLYINYTKKLQQKFIWESPIFGNNSLEYGVTHTIDENCSETNKIYINAKGISLEERSLNDIKKGIYPPQSSIENSISEEIESNMEVLYKLYGEDRSIFSIVGTFKTKIAPNTYSTHNVGIYHIPKSREYRPKYSLGLRESNKRFHAMMNQEDKDVFVIRSSKNYQTKERTSKSLDFNFFIDEEPLPQKKTILNLIKNTFKKK